jgi:hypothetical protein
VSRNWKRLVCAFTISVCVAIYLVASRTAWLPAYLRLPGPPAPQPATRNERWQQDVRYLGDQLARLHVDAFHTTDRQTFEQAIAALDAAVPALSDLEIVLEIQRIVAAVGDAHTRAVPPSSIPLDLYPLRLRWLKDGFYVTGAVEPYQEAVGAKVVQIDTTPVEDAFDRVAPFVAHETETGLRDRAWLYLLSPEILHTVGVLNNTQPGRYILERSDGTLLLLDLSAVSADEYFGIAETLPAGEPLYLRHPDELYWFEYLADEQMVYLHYERCQDMERLPFRDFVAGMFAFIETNPVERLVIDLRENGGGDSEHIKPLMEALARRPALDRAGHLFVVVGRGTYSSAMLNVVELDQQTNAVFVGEPPASVPDHYGQVASFALPNSRVRIDYSTKHFPITRRAAGEKLGAGDWLGVLGYSSASFPFSDGGSDAYMPDLLVQPTIEDYFGGRDAALEAILDIAHGSCRHQNGG